MENYEAVKLLNSSLYILDLSSRSWNHLIKKDIYLISDLVRLSKKNLRDIYSIGDKLANEIIDKVHKLGLSFEDEVPTFDVNLLVDEPLAFEPTIDSLAEISICSRTCLKRAGIYKLSMVSKVTTDELGKYVDITRRNMNEILLVLHRRNLYFADEITPEMVNDIDKSVKSKASLEPESLEAIGERIAKKEELLQMYDILSKKKESLIEEEKQLDNEIKEIVLKLSKI